MIQTVNHPLYEALENLGGLRFGHTEFRGGGHGDGWIEKGALFSSPRDLEPIVRLQAQQIAHAFPYAEVLVGSSQCGATLAAMVARELGARVAFTARDASDRFAFHRMYLPPPGTSLVLVEDLIFSGRDLREQARFFADCGLGLLGVSAWTARAGANTGAVAVKTLMPHPFRTFAEENCPLCQSGEPVQWRGIRE